ncbi:tRNA pseudouridine(55) synthase TruB [Buchnera aphidicola]|uniref:tRNA pseudouridine(55) synthase TruB n=1 Tax=Buchnera aphidicola TaxID=9 RepID=UPI003463A3D2
MFFFKKRNVHGLLLLDKPKGVSSNYILQKVKRIFHAKKAGYTGTLDPLATGMLPICFGETTKFSHYLTDSQKKYHVVAKLGEKTTTSDSCGALLEKRSVSFSLIQLHASINELTGLIDQIPSMYSAIKYHGKPLYKYARQGLTINRKMRKIFIYKIDLINYANNVIELYVHCSKGTYIRTLIEDLGEKLGCGAHITFLRRLQVASYIHSQLVNMIDLYKSFNRNDIYNIDIFKKLDQFLMPIDSPVSFLPKIFFSIQQTLCFQLGQKVCFICDIKNSLVRVIDTETRKFLGLGKINSENFVIPHRLVSTMQG